MGSINLLTEPFDRRESESFHKIALLTLWRISNRYSKGIFECIQIR